MKQTTVDISPQRRKIMAAIRSKDTKAEVKLRRMLWHSGLRYRSNYTKLPGKPDIVMKKYKLAIFVDGEFWHGRNWEQAKKRINTRSEFWINKIERNMERDKRVNAELGQMGYEVLRFWDTEVNKNVGSCVRRILNYIDAVQTKDVEI